ncbi:MAG: SusC/RagA family TonB-linked outer membrane protein [Sphingobacteriales bacterium]|nr:SusC/RagA family TonB-linked outer membrane protein [Sphingobacteriales bacterium]
MKLTLILLFGLALAASANKANSQERVNLSISNGTLETFLKEVSRQTGYQYLLQNQFKQAARAINIHVQNATLAEVLELGFSGQPLTYEIIKKVIIVRGKGGQPIPPAPADSIPVRGVVFNESRQPLSAATVSIKGSTVKILTNEKGEFQFPRAAPGMTLVITYVGYGRREMVIPDNKYLEVYLQVAVNELDKTVVQAYGTTSQRLTTGNIGKITADEIEKQPIMNPVLMLEGKVPGLEVTQTSGFGTAPVKLELRGRGALSTTMHSDPLYVIDGVPLTIVGLNDGYYIYGSPGFLQNGMGGPAGGQSPLFSINPADIESIEILKDADATAIYGSRGANGVILITTKKGKPGQTRFDLNVQQGVTHVSRYYDLLNTQQYLAMRHEAFRNDGVSPDPIADFDINGTWDTTRYTNWQKALYGKTGQATNITAGLSGGNAQTSYRLGGTYNRVSDITTASGADQRGSLSFNLQHRSSNQRFKLGFATTYSLAKSDMVTIPGVAAMAPDAPAIYDQNGKLNWAGWGGQGDNANARSAFPFFVLNQPYSAKTNFLNASMLLTYNIVADLSASVNLGYNNAWNTQTLLRPISSLDPEQQPTGTSTWGYNNNRNWIAEPQLTYNTIIGGGKLNVLAGASVQQTNTDGMTIEGDGYTTDDLLSNLSSAPSKTVSQFNGQYRYAAAFGRITYNWSDKYIINFNGRRDGSSRFGPGKQFGNFGSVAAAWIFTEEPWFKKHLPVLSFGKLRASYGTTGSDAIGDYQYLTQYTSNYTFPYGGVTTYRPTVQANPNYQWQVNKKLEVAFNAGILKDRITMQLAYYRNRCSNQLIAYPLPTLTGFSSVTANSAASLQNDGWEYSAAVKVVETPKFTWSVDFNISFNRNRLLAYPNLALSPFAGKYLIGKPLNIQRVLHFTGIDPLTGTFTFEDRNHDGQLTFDYTAQRPDDTYPVDLSPQYFGGFGTNFTYAGFNLSMFFNFKKQKGPNALVNNIPGTLNANTLVEAFNRWQQPGDTKPYAAFTQNPYSSSYNYFYTNSDGVFTDASFVRLANLSLSWNIPAKAAKMLSIQGCTLFVHANNLLLITSYKGADPESQNLSSLPPTKTVVGGISVHF